jgi:hypothetical protein
MLEEQNDAAMATISAIANLQENALDMQPLYKSPKTATAIAMSEFESIGIRQC